MPAIVVKKRRENKLQELQEEIYIAVNESILITRVQNNFAKFIFLLKLAIKLFNW